MNKLISASKSVKPRAARTARSTVAHAGARIEVGQASETRKVKPNNEVTITVKSVRVARRRSGWDEVVDLIKGHRSIAFSPEKAHRLLMSGMPGRLIEPISVSLGMPKNALAGFMGLDRSTVSRLSASDKIVPMHSAESLLRLVELREMADDTFASHDEAGEWMSKPHPLLDGMSPLEFAKSSYGGQRVKDILLAIKYGGAV